MIKSFKTILISVAVAVVATVLLSLGLAGCGMSPSSACTSHNYEVSSETGDCYKDGEIVEKCSKCGHTRTSPNPKGHRYTNTIKTVDATCFEDGYYIQQCSRCVLTNIQTIPKGHKYAVVETTATCVEDGVEVKECSACHDRIESAVAARGHNPVSIGTAINPTCTSDGITAGSKCSTCGTVLEEQVVLPKEHKLNDNMKCVFCGVIFNKHNVTFDSDNGSAPVTEEYIHGSTLNFPAPPTKLDSVFIGWYIGNVVCSENYTVSEAVTVVAKYAPIVKISDVAGLNAIADNPGGFYKLTKDINMRGEALPVIDEFSGILDGDGHTVRDAMLSVIANATDENYGLIRVNTGTVKNIKFEDMIFTADSLERQSINVGVIAGINKGVISGVTLHGGTIVMDFDNYVNSRAKLELNAYYGGIVGLNDEGGTIFDCSNSLSINSKMYLGNYNSSTLYMGSERNLTGGVGGIAGGNNGSISECAFEGDIAVSAYGRNVASNGGGYNEKSNISACIGGIVGRSGENATVTQCYSVGEFKLSSRIGNYGHIYGYVGGLVGVNYGQVSNSFSDGSVVGDSYDGLNMGGLVGESLEMGKIVSCHSSVEISAKIMTNNGVGYAGGIIGKNSAAVQMCYATGNVTVINKVSAGGFVGGNMSSGTVRNSYSTGNITARCEEKMSMGDCGYFAGTSALSSVLYKCRYFSGSIVMCGGEYVQQNEGTGNNAPQSISARQLWTENFLAQDFNWDTDAGWVVLDDDNPILVWELQRGHDFESKTIAPTHEYGGYTAYHCSDCGRVYISNYTAPLGHTYQAVRTVAPTCTEQGYDVVLCTKDGCDFDGEVHINYTPATGHSKGENAQPVSIETAATCGESGVGEYVCSECGKNFTADIPATGNHTWVDVAAKAAVACTANICGEEGHSAYRYCSVCGLIDGKTVLAPHVDANMDNICDMCKGFTFTTVSKTDFIQISDAAGLAAIANDLSKNYILAKDIDLTGVEWNALGSKSEPFTGMLYGDGHKIIGLTANLNGVSGTAAVGLFRYNRGKIIGVTLNGFTLNAQNSDVVFGGIAAYNYGEIIDCVISGDNSLQYYSAKTIVSSNGNSSCGFVFTLTAGGFAGINGANGRVVGCSITGNIVSKNAVYGEIVLNVGSTIWSAAGSVLNNVIFGTQLSVTQSVTFGGLVGTNSGEVSGCQVTGEINIYSVADANLVQLKGKLTVKTELYAGSLIGYNAGEAMGNSASAISYEIPSEYKHIGIPYIVTGKAYELTYQIVNHGSDGNGKIGVDASV